MTASYSPLSFRRRPESSGFIQHAFGFVLALRGDFACLDSGLRQNDGMRSMTQLT